MGFIVELYDTRIWDDVKWNVISILIYGVINVFSKMI